LENQNSKNGQSNILCALPFVHPFFDVRGYYFPCCNAVNLTDQTKHVSELTAEEWFYSDTMNTLRADMINGVRNELCTHCWKKDDIGISSPRIAANEYWKNKYDHNNPVPKFFDLKPSNHCNLACIFCTASSSDKIVKITESLAPDDKPSRWEGAVKTLKQREKDFGISFDPTVVDYIKRNIKDLELLKFTGGEPFLSKDVLEILTLVSDLKPEVEIKITTNGTVITKEFYPILKKMKKTSIKFSIDAVDDLYSYIRFPSKWPQFQKRIENNMKHLPDVNFNVNCLITNMNLEQIPKIRDWYKDLESKYSNLKFIIIDPNLNPIDNESSLYMMDPEVLLQIKEKLKEETQDWDMSCHTDSQISNVYKKIDDAVKNNLFAIKEKHYSKICRLEFIRQNKIRNTNISSVVEPITKTFFEQLELGKYD